MPHEANRQTDTLTRYTIGDMKWYMVQSHRTNATNNEMRTERIKVRASALLVAWDDEWCQDGKLGLFI